MKSKKGFFFSPGLVLISLFILIEVYIVLDSKESIFGADPIGDRQSGIFNAYLEGESTFFFIEESAERSSHQALYDIASSGGCMESEKYLGYSKWNSLCKSSFSEDFFSRLNEGMPQNNYALRLEKGRLSGSTDEKIKIPIKSGQDVVGEYSINPSFGIPLAYDFSDYKWLETQASEMKKFISQCKNSGQKTDYCVELAGGQNFFNDIGENKLKLLEKAQCETPEKEAFLDFVEYFEACIESEIPSGTGKILTGCACPNKPKMGDFEIRQLEGDKATINGEVNGRKYSIESDADAGMLKNLVNERITAGIMIYKDIDNHFIISPDLGSATVSCSLKPKTTYRFCVQSNDNKFIEYKEETGKTELKNVVYKFALNFSDDSLPSFDANLDAAKMPEEKQQGLIPIEGMYCEGDCLLQKEAYLRLLEANEMAKKSGFELSIYSSYRSLEKQKELWESYAVQYPDPEVRDDYVCNPSGPSPYETCPHLTGKAVDIRIKGKASNSQMSEQDWQKLAEVMYATGWVRYTPELWHFEYGTTRWARANEANVNVIV